MAAKGKPYDQFGRYILFKKLEGDALGDLHRAGRIDDGVIGATVAIRRLTGGNRDALVAGATAARQVAPLLTGTSFARNQVIDVLDGVPFIAHDYAGGRSLRHIVNRARGGQGLTANPIPIDQAIVIAEKVALSLATTTELRFAGERLIHGALIPQFVWVEDDGEIRVSGQQLGPGLVASLKDPMVAAEIARYVSPEYQQTAQPSKTSEVFSLGAILYLVVTGLEPPDATSTSAFMNIIRAAKTMAGATLPDQVRVIIEKSLSLDPSTRFATPAEMKQALSALAGNYSATTFNLAFYLSNLLKKETEGEAVEHERESRVNPAAYVTATPAAVAAHQQMTLTAPPPSKSKLPMAIAAVLALILIGAGAWFGLGYKTGAAPPTATITSAAAPGLPKQTGIISEPILASPPSTTGTSSPATSTAGTPGDEAARKKAFEDAVKVQLHDEMMKLQAAYTKNLQRSQSSNAPVPNSSPVTPAPTATVAEERALSASQLDQQRREAPRAQETAPPKQTLSPETQAAAVTQTVSPAATQPAAVHEGDIVEMNELDTMPQLTRRVMPLYPPMAARQRMEGTVLLSALISESGDVVDVKVLRGVGRMGFDEAAIRAVKAMKFSPGIKDGKRVRTWFPLPIQFKL